MGYVDYRILFPEFNYTEELLNKELKNLAYHLHQQVSEILSWPNLLRTQLWKETLEQINFENSENNG